MEPSIYYFNQLTLYAEQFSTVTTAIQNAANASVSTGLNKAIFAKSNCIGVCLIPIISSANTTTGLKVAMVYKDGSNLKVIGINAAGTSAVEYTSGGIVETLPFLTSDSSSLPSMDLNMGTLNSFSWVDSMFYANTMEFKFAFIDYQVFKYYTTDDSFYNTPPGTDVARGIQIERALVKLDLNRERNWIDLVFGNYNDMYRSVKITPLPAPDIVNDPNNTLPQLGTIGSIAYYVAPVCPPFWKSQLLSAMRTGDGPDTGAARQVVIDVNDDLAPIYTVNMGEIADQLETLGYLPKDKAPYRHPIWQAVVTIVSAVAALLAGGYAVGKFG